MPRIRHILKLTGFNFAMLLVGVLLLGRSVLLPADKIERIRAFTRWQEFDYVNWMLDALGMKNSQAALDTPRYLSVAQQREVVYQYLDLVGKIDSLSYQISLAYADPKVKDPQTATAELNRRLIDDRALETRLGPLAESVLQSQISFTIRQMGLSAAGQPVPPVLYHTTPLPYALIVSPRDKIEQQANISLVPGLTLEQRVGLEDRVAQRLDVSSLVVGIGGVGVYPTMVMSTTDLNWLAEVVSHEWTHNFLTLRPLGISYDSTPEMRTINETTASISGQELGRAMIARFYPEILPPPAPEESAQPTAPAQTQTPPPFDFRKEMHATRVHVDELLAQGKVQEAEDYMEQRRQVFWDHGYLIRKLNQAYFAFYGAYNDQPGGGASGQDPVGPAVQALRKKSASLADFLFRISRITSFAELQRMVK